jgi:hypothetical protein
MSINIIPHAILINYNKYLFTFIYVFLCSCNIDGTYENRESDKKEGEKIADTFYKLIQQRDYAKTYSLYTERFFTITDTSKLATLYVQIDSTCGNIKDYTMANWKTTIVKGSNPVSEYAYLYDVNREKCKTRETILLKKENGKVRIISYDVQVN